MKPKFWTIFFSVILLMWIVGWGQTARSVRVPDEAPSMLSPIEMRSESSESEAASDLPEWARLVDIQDVNPAIALDIRYATANNFLKTELYSVPRCLLRASVAEQLSQVQEELETMGLGLKVFDCYRPLSVTRKMWEVLPDPRYVANPERGSRHNRGAAVDLTLVDRYGTELEMPTDFDDFSDRAARDYQGADVSDRARKNSQLLEEVMTAHGFLPLITEWWHFDAEGWEEYSILDVSLDAIP